MFDEKRDQSLEQGRRGEVERIYRGQIKKESSLSGLIYPWTSRSLSDLWLRWVCVFELSIGLTFPRGRPSPRGISHFQFSATAASWCLKQSELR